MAEVHTVRKVFVPGGLPTITYNARQNLQLEDQVFDYLDSPYFILSVSGPTKTGKTVLMKHICSNGIWLSGGSIETVDNFFEEIADHFDIESSTEVSVLDSAGGSDEFSAAVGISSTKGSAKRRKSSKTETTYRQTKPRSIKVAVRESLRGSDRALVIDDFHYIPQEAQLKIVRFLKELVFEGLPVILISVPHRAFDAVRVEKEMTGRFKVLNVGFWTPEELSEIAYTGFRALNLGVGSDVIERLVGESFRSPHLMQDFCRGLCSELGVEKTLAEGFEPKRAVNDWENFFKARATAASKTAFDLLARGPRQRSDRKVRNTRDGTTVDIYGATLAAIGHTGPLTSITYEQIRSAFREVLVNDVPQRHEITRVLEEMAKIARNDIEGEPVVDYSDELSTLYISDPFFAYYLRWGSQNISS